MPRILGYLRKNVPGILLQDGVVVPNVEVERKFKWEHASTFCELDEWKETFAQAVKIRDYTIGKASELIAISNIAEKLVERSKEWGLPLTFPTIVDSDIPMFTFDELWPVKLIGRKVSTKDGEMELTAKHLEPIRSVEEISGVISIMTGENAAGKTTVGEEIIGLLYDAASGLPVFGKNVKLNLRNVIGTIFLERGEGSTMQLSLLKIAKVMEEVAKHPQNGTIVFWDELGTGTTPAEGELLGRTCLEQLSRIGCTVLANTQLSGLASWAQTTLKARCFVMNAKHRIEKGIGEANVLSLAREMGVSKVLGFK